MFGLEHIADEFDRSTNRRRKLRRTHYLSALAEWSGETFGPDNLFGA